MRNRNGAVLTGFYKEGKLQFFGSVRNDFVPASRCTAYARLRSLEARSVDS